MRPADMPTQATAVGMNSQLKGIVLDDQLNPPPAGKGLVRVIQAASRTGSQRRGAGRPGRCSQRGIRDHDGLRVGLRRNLAVASQLGRIARADDLCLRLDRLGHRQFADRPGRRGKQGGLTLKSIVDAGGTAVTPAGSVNAGGGGMAAHPNWFDRFGWTGIGALLRWVDPDRRAGDRLGRNRSARHSG